MMRCRYAIGLSPGKAGLRERDLLFDDAPYCHEMLIDELKTARALCAVGENDGILRACFPSGLSRAIPRGDCNDALDALEAMHFFPSPTASRVCQQTRHCLAMPTPTEAELRRRMLLQAAAPPGSITGHAALIDKYRRASKTTFATKTLYHRRDARKLTHSRKERLNGNRCRIACSKCAGYQS